MTVPFGSYLNGNSSLSSIGGTDDTPAAVAKLIKTYIVSGKRIPSISSFDDDVLPAGKCMNP